MASYSTSAMAYPALKHATAPNTRSVSYSGTFSASISDEIQIMRIPNGAVIDFIVVNGSVAATAASLLLGDDAGSKSRFGTVSLSNTTQASMIVTGAGYRYSLSDDDREAVLLATASANTSASGSCSINFIVHYHI